MIRITFCNLERSELAKEVISDRLTDAKERFPRLLHHRFDVKLSMENSPDQSGPDLFGVKLSISGPIFGGLVLEKRAANLYLAASLLQEALLEALNRASDKPRVKDRRNRRLLKKRQRTQLDVSRAS